MSQPDRPVRLPLAGAAVHVEPEHAHSVFNREFPDLEQLLALHRFAWVPLIDDPAWTQVLWKAWLEKFESPTEGDWAWHPYTAAERAITLLDFGRRFGLPEPLDQTLTNLTRHAREIAARLEYYGETGTSNHLSNNGRGLLTLGVELGLEAYAALGAKIMVTEASRLFLPSGVLREGSSHYHALVANRYAEAADFAKRASLPEEPKLRGIAARALAVTRQLVLPGGMPLIGDISPDLTPELVLAEAKARSDTQTASTEPVGLAEDGWVRATRNPWAGLWYVSPSGWPPVSGHGHQDCGSFEVHLGDQALFIDVGRGAYGEGEAALASAGSMHNTLQIDGLDPYPDNKPYYSDAFRTAVCGSPPKVDVNDDGDSALVRIQHSGFSRFHGCGDIIRQWQFTSTSMTITDTVEGTGSHRICRRLHTAHPVTSDGEDVIIDLGKTTVRMTSSDSTPIRARPTKRWRSYGREETATVLEIDRDAVLPWHDSIRVELI